jgi:hypothetical protein
MDGLTYFKMLYGDLLWKTEENHEKPQVRTVSDLAKILTWYLLITNVKHYCNTTLCGSRNGIYYVICALKPYPPWQV